MKPIRLFVFVLFLTSVAAIVGAPPASAHTGFESSTPSDGSTVDGPVETITLVFSGDAEPTGEGFVVLDPDGQIREPTEVSSTDSLTWELRFDPPITGGVVGVRWTVVAPDAHPIDGSFSFTTPVVVKPPPTTTESPTAPDPTELASQDVEQPTVAAQPEALEDFLDTDETDVTTSRRVGAVGRFFTVSGTLLGVGGLMFAATAMRGRRSDVRHVMYWVRRAGPVIVLGTFVELAAHVATQNGGSWSALWSLSALTATAGSAFGLATALRVLGGFALAGGSRLDTVAAAEIVDPVVSVRERVGSGSAGSYWNDVEVNDGDRLANGDGMTHPEDHAWLPGIGSSGAVFGAASILVAYLFDGHTVSKGNRIVTGVVDMIHVAGGAVWAGGIAMLAVVLWRRHREARELRARQLALRFSVLASVASVVVGVAGLVLSVIVLDSPSALWATEWGRILMIKTVLVAVATAAGAYNHKVLIPQLERSPADPKLATHFRNVVTGELAVLVAVVIATAILMGAAS